MIVYSKYNINSKYPVGEYIRGGLDGEVFCSDNNVIKFVAIKDNKKQATLAWNKNKRNIEYIIDNSPKHFVKVIDFGLLKVIEEEYSIIYFYLMEKLNEISKDEFTLFNKLMFCENSSKIRKNLNLIDNFNKSLNFDKVKVIEFIDKITKSRVVHCDIHARNIMKDDCGNFKFIDLERLKI